MRIGNSPAIRNEIAAMTRETARQEELNYRVAQCIGNRMTVAIDRPDFLRAVSELAGYYQVTRKRLLPLVVLGRRIGLSGSGLTDFIGKYLPHTTVYRAEELMKDPYMERFAKVFCDDPMAEGSFRFERTHFNSGELFFDREPAADGYGRVDAIGIMDGEADYPALYENGRCWMSITPNEIVTMQAPLEEASGDVLTLGLGLGYYAYMAHLRDEVKSVTVVEREPAVIGAFEKFLLPRFDHPEKIRIVREDAVRFLLDLEDGVYSYCFADIWQDPLSGMETYLRTKAAGNRFRAMRCSYWIEESFIGALEQSAANVLQFAFLGEDDAQMRGQAGYETMKQLLADTEIREPEEIRRMFGGTYVRELLQSRLTPR